MDLYEYAIEENKVLNEYNKKFKALDNKLTIPDTLNNCKHNLEIKKSQLELAKYYNNKAGIEKLKVDINYYISKIKKAKQNIYDNLFTEIQNPRHL